MLMKNHRKIFHKCTEVLWLIFFSFSFLFLCVWESHTEKLIALKTEKIGARFLFFFLLSFLFLFIRGIIDFRRQRYCSMSLLLGYATLKLFLSLSLSFFSREFFFSFYYSQGNIISYEWRNILSFLASEQNYYSYRLSAVTFVLHRI